MYTYRELDNLTLSNWVVQKILFSLVIVLKTDHVILSWKHKMVIYQHRQPVLSNQKQKIHNYFLNCHTRVKTAVQINKPNQNQTKQGKKRIAPILRQQYQVKDWNPIFIQQLQRHKSLPLHVNSGIIQVRFIFLNTQQQKTQTFLPYS